MIDFTDQDALVSGSWDSRFARVLAKAVVGARAVAVIDANGAQGGRVYENIDTYTWTPDAGWHSSMSTSGLSSGWVDGIAWASGQGTPGEEIAVEYHGVRHPTEVQPSGYWVVAIEDDTPDNEYPVRIT